MVPKEESQNGKLSGNASEERNALAQRVYGAWEINDQEESSVRWSSPMFRFVRSLKADPELSFLDCFTAAEKVEHCLCSLADPDTPGPLDVWELWFPKSSDPRAEFTATWDKIRFPGDTHVLQTAFEISLQQPLEPARAYSHRYSRFVSLAGHLQRLRPGLVIKLPVVNVARLLICDSTSVSSYRHWAVKEGLLRKIREHDFNRSLCSEFIFAVEAFDWSTGRQIKISLQSNENEEKNRATRSTRDLKDYRGIMSETPLAKPASSMESARSYVQSDLPNQLNWAGMFERLVKKRSM
jgi:hypothetical protein